MAELADAHGSGPCESNLMEVQVLLAAPSSRRALRFAAFLHIQKHGFVLPAAPVSQLSSFVSAMSLKVQACRLRGTTTYLPLLFRKVPRLVPCLFINANAGVGKICRLYACKAI